MQRDIRVVRGGNSENTNVQRGYEEGRQKRILGIVADGRCPLSVLPRKKTVQPKSTVCLLSAEKLTKVSKTPAGSSQNLQESFRSFKNRIVLDCNSVSVASFPSFLFFMDK